MFDTIDAEKHFAQLRSLQLSPFSVGETGKLGLAEERLAMATLLLSQRHYPLKDGSPTIRIVSEILKSNGSSSMASVCGGTLLWWIGVKIESRWLVAIGLITADDKFSKYAILSDILGKRTTWGTWTLKLRGKDGITAFRWISNCRVTQVMTRPSPS